MATPQFVTFATTADYPAGERHRILDAVVPAEQIWRPHYFAAERVAGNDAALVIASVIPAGTTESYIVNQFWLVDNFLRKPMGTIWGPGDRVRLFIQPDGPITLKLIMAAVIETPASHYTPPAPPPEPALTGITPPSVKRGVATEFTVTGTALDQFATPPSVTVIRPNATTIERDITFRNATTAKFTYDPGTTGPHKVKLHGVVMITNEVTFLVT